MLMEHTFENEYKSLSYFTLTLFNAKFRNPILLDFNYLFISCLFLYLNKGFNRIFPKQRAAS